MANIPRKFLKTINYREILKTDNGELEINESYTNRALLGAVFPLRGQERRLELQGLIKVGTLKIYTNDRVDITKDIIVDYNNLKYKLSKTIGGFQTDELNTYYLEVLE